MARKEGKKASFMTLEEAIWRRQQVAEMREQGLKGTEIARRLGVSKQRIYELLRMMNGGERNPCRTCGKPVPLRKSAYCSYECYPSTATGRGVGRPRTHPDTPAREEIRRKARERAARIKAGRVKKTAL